jgi:hypothetical protein
MTDASVDENLSLESLVAGILDDFRQRQKRGETATWTARPPPRSRRVPGGAG